MTDTAVVVAEPKAIVLIKAALEERIDDIAAVLPEGMKPERFVRTALLAISKNPDLMACSQASLVRSIVEAAEVGLEPTGSLSRAWLVPFKDKDKVKAEATLIIGYQGLADLMRDTGRVRQVWAEVVYEGDEFGYELGMAPILRHVPAHVTEDPTKMTYAYACARFADGEVQFHVMTRQQVDLIRAKSRARNGPAWTGSYPAMARKSALRQLANYVPLSTKAQGAIERDDEREFGTPPETSAETRASQLREKFKGRFGPTPPVDAPSAPETVEVAVDPVPDVSASQQPESIAVDDAGEASTLGAVCGVLDQKLNCGPCILPLGHKATPHKDAKGGKWAAYR